MWMTEGSGAVQHFVFVKLLAQKRSLESTSFTCVDKETCLFCTFPNLPSNTDLMFEQVQERLYLQYRTDRPWAMIITGISQ